MRKATTAITATTIAQILEPLPPEVEVHMSLLLEVALLAIEISYVHWMLTNSSLLLLVVECEHNIITFVSTNFLYLTSLLIVHSDNTLS